MIACRLARFLATMSATLSVSRASQTSGDGASGKKSATSSNASSWTKLRSGRVYGSQLMTAEERFASRTRMRSAKTAEERQRVYDEHHKEMPARIKESSMTPLGTLPARHRSHGMGMDSGAGTGPAWRLGSGSRHA